MTGRVTRDAGSASDSCAPTGETGPRLDVDAAAVGRATEGLDPETRDALAGLLSTLHDGQDDGRTEQVEDVAGEVGPATLVAAYEPAVEQLVAETVGDPVEDPAATTLLEGLEAVFDDIERGVRTGGERVAPGTALDLGQMVDAIPHSAFLIADDHTVLSYNRAVADQLSIDETAMLGEDCRESIAAATYSDGRRHDTLADKVAEAPRRADEEYDVDRTDDDYAFGDQVVYEDRSVMHNTEGEERHISFQAMPLFADGDCVGVLELVEDRSTEVRRQRAMGALVNEVCETLEALAAGDFSARAEFEGDASMIDGELLRIVAQVNEMIDDFEALIGEVGAETDALAESIDRAAEAAAEISRQVGDQNAALEQVAQEMEEFSATMEEVAASADQVSEAADGALEEAERGREAGQEARAAADEVLETSQDLVDTVDDLDAYMAEIEEVTEVIADVAEQTNMLALNASIEAARADAEGDGFAVVADEIKQLANETRSHTEDIADRVETVQIQTAETVAEVERSHERVETADDRIEAAVDSLAGIARAMEDAAAGIGEVAEANDEQAATVEEVLGTVEQASEGAASVDETVENIVRETDRQQESVDRLTERVRALTE